MSCLRTQHSDAGEAGTRGHSVSSQHSATVLPAGMVKWINHLPCTKGSLVLSLAQPVCLMRMQSDSQEFSRQIQVSRTFQESPTYSSTFQACQKPYVPANIKALIRLFTFFQFV